MNILKFSQVLQNFSEGTKVRVGKQQVNPDVYEVGIAFGQSVNHILRLYAVSLLYHRTLKFSWGVPKTHKNYNLYSL
jgi:hypothetical protein